MPKQLTIRQVPDNLARRLARVSREQGKSVNSTVLQILEQALGVNERRERLARYATWTQEDLDDFGKALAGQRVIDDSLWR